MNEIKRSFRELALKYHPDQNKNVKNADERFREIAEAYDVLSDPKKRARYDRFGHIAALESISKSPSYPIEIENLKQFIGGLWPSIDSRKESSSDYPKEVKKELEISLKEAVLGVEKKLDFSFEDICSFCNGEGNLLCNVCHGKGLEKGGTGGRKEAQKLCTFCGGRGRLKDACLQCKGKGKHLYTYGYPVILPKGIESGYVKKIKVDNQNPLSKRVSEIQLLVKIEPHPFFTLQGFSIHCEIPLTLTQAILGGKVRVPTIEGRVLELTIPPSTLGGTMFRIPGKGFPLAMGLEKRGDLYVKVLIEPPHLLTKEQEVLFWQFNELLQRENYPKQQAFLKMLEELNPKQLKT